MASNEIDVKILRTAVDVVLDHLVADLGIDAGGRPGRGLVL